MKNLKNLIYIMLAVLVFTACENDDFGPVEGEFTMPSQVKIGFTDDNEGMSIIEAGGMVSLELSLSNPVSYDAVFQLELTSSDGSLETTAGVTEVTYPTVATISAGQTSTTVDLTFADDTIDDVMETYTLSIADITSETSMDSFVLLGETSRVLNVFDSLPLEITTTGGDVGVTLSWTDSGYDMDLYIVEGNQDLNGAVVDSSLGFTTTEPTTLPSDVADGDYSVYINQYLFTADVPYTMTFDFPDGAQEVLMGTVSEDSFVITFSKTTNGSEIVYAISQL